ncbi:MAG: histidine kinase [Bacteroidales bacterium]|nr:histidine kinase [Bacteroidales bacterium]
MQVFAAKKGVLAGIVNNRWFQHLTYWLVFVLFFAFTWGSYDQNYGKTLLVELINLPVKVVLVYVVIYFLFPNFLFKGEVWGFTVLFLFFLFFAAIIQRLSDNYLIIDSFFPDWEKAPTLSVVQVVRSAINLGAVLAIPMTIKVMEYLSQVWQHEQLMARDKLEAELAFLKNQVQPHFLFNTLNSLYSLILKKSDQSLSVILKLSGLLRYMLYETNGAQVELHNEIECVRSYLELEKIRYGDRLDLSFNTWGEWKGKTIAPLLILPFIENSFKHSTRSVNGKAWITIELGVRNRDLILKVENSVSFDRLEAAEPSVSGGIGLKNVHRRLSLLYPNSYDLKIERTIDSYLVIVKLELKESRQ